MAIGGWVADGGVSGRLRAEMRMGENADLSEGIYLRGSI